MVHKKKPINKRLIIIIISLFVFIFFTASFILRLLPKSKPNTDASIIKKEFVTLPSSSEEIKIAKSIISWLDDQRNESGTYYSVRNCTVKDECTITGDSHRNGAAAIMARYRYYLVTKDSSQLDQIKSDLSSIISLIDSGKFTLQNNHYSCYLLSDLYFDTSISQEIRDMAKKVCYIGSYEILTNPFKYELFRDEVIPQYQKNVDNTPKSTEIKNISLDKIKSFLNNSYTPTKASDLNYRYAYFASDLVSKAEILDNSKYLNSAIFVFDKILDNYLNSYNDLSVDQRLSISTASLDLYRATKENLYLDFAKVVFDKEKDNYFYNLDSAIQHRISAEALSRVTNEKQYIDNRKSFYDYVIKNYYHNTKMDDNEFYKGVLYSPSSNMTVQQILQNALFASLICQ